VSLLQDLISIIPWRAILERWLLEKGAGEGSVLNDRLNSCLTLRRLMCPHIEEMARVYLVSQLLSSQELVESEQKCTSCMLFVQSLHPVWVHERDTACSAETTAT